MAPKTFLVLEADEIWREFIQERVSKESTNKEDDTEDNKPNKGDDCQGDPEDSMIDESGEAEKKIHELLLLHWCMIHNVGNIIPVLVVSNV